MPKTAPYFLLLLALLAATCDGAGRTLNTGAVAPDFVAVRLDGTPARFPDDFRGKPVVLRFWADWCPYCRGEMLAIERVRQRRPGLVVLAVNVGQDRKMVAKFVEETGVGFLELLDEQSTVGNLYGVSALPTTFFVAADGVIKTKVVGEVDEGTFDRLAGALLR